MYLTINKIKNMDLSFVSSVLKSDKYTSIIYVRERFDGKFEPLELRKYSNGNTKLIACYDFDDRRRTRFNKKEAINIAKQFANFIN